MFDANEVEMMLEAIFMVKDEHGILCADGHWMTNDELLALPEEEVIALCNLIYGRN